VETEQKVTMTHEEAHKILALLLEESEQKATDATRSLVRRMIAAGNGNDVEMAPSEMGYLKVTRVMDELDTWEGLTRHWSALRQYTEEAEWEGNFPHGFSDLKVDLARYIVYSD